MTISDHDPDARFWQACDAEVTRRMSIVPPMDVRATAKELHARLGWKTTAEEGMSWRKGLGKTQPQRGMLSVGEQTRRTDRGLGNQTLHGNSWAGWMLAVAVVALGVFGVTALRHHVTTTAPRPLARTYTTAAGQQATVTLADGSKAILAPVTTLHVSYATEGGTIVKLTGQALFTVTPRAQAPFIVRTAHVGVQVLGTSFVVRQYAADRIARIAVLEGRVALRGAQHAKSQNAKSQNAVLTANSVGVVGDSGQMTITPNIAIEDYTTWTTGNLVFRKAPIRDIVADLGRAYGFEIRVADSSLAMQTMTWTVPLKKVTISGALDVLTATLDAHVVQSGKTITIVPGPSTSRTFRGLQTPLTSEPHHGR
jgi:ferric-dicitrate binding protein FerR (iron transport regulator)